jgi:hypothetical protein
VPFRSKSTGVGKLSMDVGRSRAGLVASGPRAPNSAESPSERAIGQLGDQLVAIAVCILRRGFCEIEPVVPHNPKRRRLEPERALTSFMALAVTASPRVRPERFPCKPGRGSPSGHLAARTSASPGFTGQ